MNLNLRATLVQKISKKGTPYLCVEVYLTDTYKKTVFLEDAEVELLKVLHTED